MFGVRESLVVARPYPKPPHQQSNVHGEPPLSPHSGTYVAATRVALLQSGPSAGLLLAYGDAELEDVELEVVVGVFVEVSDSIWAVKLAVLDCIPHPSTYHVTVCP